ncbi:unnamed protein product [Prorocentrum cordatum]|uniref:Uncharacterized protein n=1 Tax=Prorocentrum cordatum TaxID=2364126 RepID=A0ABN9YD67_9DINO|nr:unnamed protein product [Polarella glacialis]
MALCGGQPVLSVFGGKLRGGQAPCGHLVGARAARLSGLFVSEPPGAAPSPHGLRVRRGGEVRPRASAHLPPALLVLTVLLRGEDKSLRCSLLSTSPCDGLHGHGPPPPSLRATAAAGASRSSGSR